MSYKIGMYPEWWDSIEKLSLEDKGKILENIFYYSTKGEIPHNSYIEVIFNFMKNRIDADRAKYELKCETNREVGKRGGRPPKSDNPEKPTETQTVILGLKNNPEKPNSNSNSNSISNTNIKNKKDIFINNIREVIEKTEGKEYLRTKDRLNGFFLYWSEENKKGKLKYETEKTWNLESRLLKRLRNDITQFNKLDYDNEVKQLRNDWIRKNKFNS